MKDKEKQQRAKEAEFNEKMRKFREKDAKKAEDKVED